MLRTDDRGEPPRRRQRTVAFRLGLSAEPAPFLSLKIQRLRCSSCDLPKALPKPVRTLAAHQRLRSGLLRSYFPMPLHRQPFAPGRHCFPQIYALGLTFFDHQR
jgi:hypothetical protein